MAEANSGLILRIRRNFGLLVFLSTTGVLILLWYLLLGVALSGGSEMFQPPIDWTLLIFTWVIVPLCGAPIASAIALIIAALVQRTGCGFGVIVVLGVAVPLAALVIVWLGSAIARMLCIEPEDEQSGLQHMTPAPQGEA